MGYRKLLIFLLVVVFSLNVYASQMRIINGTEVPASEDRYESIVAILYNNDGEHYYNQFCGGTLISPTWVVTAAHCLQGESASGIKVMLNNYNLEQTGTVKYVKRIIMHENYDDYTLDNDIGLIELTTSVTDVNPINLNSTASLAVGQSAWSAGWGNTSITSEVYPNELMEVLLPIIGSNDCDNAYPGEITENHICAGYLNGTKDTCQGDSGGPLIIENNNQYELAGIVSWGEGCAVQDYPGVYTRVQNYSSWITNYMENSDGGDIDPNDNDDDNNNDDVDNADDLEQAYSDGIAFCQANPENCGIKTSFNLSDIENLGVGQWYLVGTTGAITNLDIFGTVQVAYIYQDGIWKANSSNPEILEELEEKGYEIFRTIPANSGVWIKK